MGIWTGIKYAINSSLGTDKFKPLDKLLTEEIINQTQIIASDDVYMSLADFVGTINKGDEEKTIYNSQSLKFTRNGSIKIKGTLESSFNIKSAIFYVEKNGVNVFESKNFEGNDTSDFSTNIIPIKAGDLLKFKMIFSEYSTGAGSIRTFTASINICGKIQQTAFDII